LGGTPGAEHPGEFTGRKEEEGGWIARNPEKVVGYSYILGDWRR